MSNSKQESMSLREGVDRMVDRATLAIGLDPDTAKVIQACNMVSQMKFPARVRTISEKLRLISRPAMAQEGYQRIR